MLNGRKKTISSVLKKYRTKLCALAKVAKPMVIWLHPAKQGRVHLVPQGASLQAQRTLKGESVEYLAQWEVRAKGKSLVGVCVKEMKQMIGDVWSGAGLFVCSVC